MATCYDCIHCDVCNGIGCCSYHCSDVSKCKFFKNKADFVKVVRCKDCMYQDDCLQKVDCDYQYREVVFCSYGTRKEGDENDT